MFHRCLRLCLLAFCLLIAPSAWAQDADQDVVRRDALLSVMAGRPAQGAWPALETLAGLGDVGAAQVLGWATAKGKGTRQDLPASFGWYLRAVASGHQDSMIDAIQVWRKMTGEQQQRAQAAMLANFRPDEVRHLKAVWQETFADFAAKQDEAARRAARAG